VKVPGSDGLKPWDLKDVDQIWAEALVRYKAGGETFPRRRIGTDSPKNTDGRLGKR